MKNPTINLYAKKVGAGHYQVDVVCEETNEEFSYIETDMTLIDSFDSDDEEERYEASNRLINKATNFKY